MGSPRDTTKETRISLYAASRYLNSSVEKELRLRIPFKAYLQDPLVAKRDPKYGFAEIFVRWEPGLADGPTSSRFAVVDYNGDTDLLAPPAKWNEMDQAFEDPEGYLLDEHNAEPLQFHQVNVWALLQRALSFFEDGNGLGRPIPFGFEGNRLIVVPHAGYGQNAFYDRTSKSLQFYYFDHEDNRVYTCLSADVVNHEFGHAVLDGIRPYLFESSLVETGAFHEFIGDLAAILILLRNNDFRRKIAKTTGGNLAEAEHLSRIAEQFGEAVKGQPYLRSACNSLKMSDIKDSDGPHKVSQVLTGAMFDILLALSDHYIDRIKDRIKDRRKRAPTAFWNAIQRMQRMAVQPLDLLPPTDVTFRDYAKAVLRVEALTNPTDPYGHYDRMLNAFVAREILTAEDKVELSKPRYLYDRLRVNVFHDIENISRSRACAYAFLDDNRDALLIPSRQDVIVADLYDAHKLTRQARRLPREIILVYIWREDVLLEGDRFGTYAGQWTSMLCGGTLIFDENGNVLSWTRKPGTVGGDSKVWQEEITAGEKRKAHFLSDLAKRIAAGQVGVALGSSKGMLGTQIPPLTVRQEGGMLRFELSPHLSLVGEDINHYQGGQQWEPSS